MKSFDDYSFEDHQRLGRLLKQWENYNSFGGPKFRPPWLSTPLFDEVREYKIIKAKYDWNEKLEGEKEKKRVEGLFPDYELGESI